MISIPQIQTHVNSFSCVTTHSDLTLSETLTNLTALEARAFRHIIFYASKSWGFCKKTYETISEEVGCSRSTVRDVVAMLKPWGVSVEHDGSAAPRIRIAEQLKKAFLQLFLPKCTANVPQTDLTIYINEKSLDDSSPSELLRGLGATSDEIYTLESRFKQQGIKIASTSNPLKYLGKCINNLRNGYHKLIRRSNEHSPSTPAPELIAQQKLADDFKRRGAERERESMKALGLI